MRRITLKPGEEFSNAHLKRTGAFNAAALTAATAIVEDVRERGDEALRDLTEKFDGVRVENFRVSQAAIAEAVASVDDKTAAALRKAAGAGVQVLARGCRVTPDTLTIAEPVKVCL